MKLGALATAAALLGLGGAVHATAAAGATPSTSSASTLTISPGDVGAGSMANNLILTYTAAATDAAASGIHGIAQRIEAIAERLETP